MAQLPLSRSPKPADRRRVAAGVLVAVVLGAASFQLLTRTGGALVHRPTSQVAEDAHLVLDSEPIAVPVKDTSDRPVYPYSIIRGGAPTPAALARAIASDPVVRAHYANFNLTNVHLVRLTQPHVVHVSYRIGDSVYWTRRPMILRTGETMLTDGVHYARTRCGNQLAAAPAAISGDEPAAEVLDTPIEAIKAPRVFPLVKLPDWTPAPVPAIAVTRYQRTPAFFGGVLGLPAERIGSHGTPGDPSLESDVSAFPTSLEPPSDPLPPSGVPPLTPSNPPTDPPSTPPTDPPAPPKTPLPPPDDPKTPEPPLPPLSPPRNPPDDPTPVPEPGTLILVAGGAAWLTSRRSRRDTMSK